MIAIYVEVGCIRPGQWRKLAYGGIVCPCLDTGYRGNTGTLSGRLIKRDVQNVK